MTVHHKFGMYCPDITFIDSEARPDDNLKDDKGILLKRNSINQMSKTFTKNTNQMHSSSKYLNLKHNNLAEGEQNYRDCYKFQVIKGNNANLVTRVLSQKNGWVDIA